MNEDRIVGAGRNMVGKVEGRIGDAAGSERLQGDGIVDQVAGAVQHGYGKAKDAVGDAIDDAPDVIADAVHRGRELGRRGDDAIRERLGDNGPLYLVGGALVLFALGAFALSRSASARPAKRRPATKPRASKPASRSAK